MNDKHFDVQVDVQVDVQIDAQIDAIDAIDAHVDVDVLQIYCTSNY